MQGQIFETLKTALRARGMTYADLAQALDLSEPTIKRLFAARDAKLSRLAAICEALDLTLADVVAQAERVDTLPMLLEAATEARLAERPALFRFFVLLREGLPPEEAGNVLREDPFALALALERLGLAQVGMGGAVRLRHAGPIRFRPGGALQRTLRALNLRFAAAARRDQAMLPAGELTSYKLALAWAPADYAELVRVARCSPPAPGGAPYLDPVLGR